VRGPGTVDRVKQPFEKEAPDFDRLILKVIPDYPRMIEALVTALPFESAAPVRIIDLGCGTGTVSRAVLDAFPNAHVTCLDFAENMVVMAKAKLAIYSSVRFTVGDFESFDGEYDAAVSSLALHHLANEEDKRRFYHHIFERLSPGGAFYNADLVLASSDTLQTKYMDHWRAFMRRNISDNEIEGKVIPTYKAEDHPAKLIDHMKWMTESGFTEVDVLWKHYNFAVYGGRKR
jgi:tRNA (cmo5U34)-methyltransferase